MLTRRDFLKGITAAASISLATSLFSHSATAASEKLVNFIVIFCDDMGYGDIGCFGSTRHRTPNVDKMADEGIKFTSFYVTSGVCTPSRCSLMTGCYPRRVNMHEDNDNRWVLFPKSPKGLNPNEMTVAEVLKTKGYSTACIGKWHLGDQKEFLPTRQGFDYYYGIPYSNDMGGRRNTGWPPLPLLKNETVIEAPVDQATITKRYTEQAINFIRKNKDKPFFIYLPHTMPHNPVNSSKDFKGKSANGGYGDAIEEIDFSTGKILAALKEAGVDNNTLVIFTSDNGAANAFGGSNKPLSGFKGSTYEGGMRVPCVMRWPDRIKANTTCPEIASTIDILPTFASITSAKIPNDRIIDGKDITGLITGKSNKSPHEIFYYYYMDQLQAVRSGKWKLYFPFAIKKVGWKQFQVNQTLKLYDLEADISESKNIADKHPEIVEKLAKLASKGVIDLGNEGFTGKGQRPAGMVISPVPLTMEK